jgi:hypothetical protein
MQKPDDPNVFMGLCFAFWVNGNFGGIKIDFQIS